MSQVLARFSGYDSALDLQFQTVNPPTELIYPGIFQIAKEVVDERFRSQELHQNDMLGSFLKHGLSRSEAETEISVTLYDSLIQPALIVMKEALING